MYLHENTMKGFILLIYCRICRIVLKQIDERVKVCITNLLSHLQNYSQTSWWKSESVVCWEKITNEVEEKAWKWGENTTVIFERKNSKENWNVCYLVIAITISGLLTYLVAISRSKRMINQITNLKVSYKCKYDTLYSPFT